VIVMTVVVMGEVFGCGGHDLWALAYRY